MARNCLRSSLNIELLIPTTGPRFLRHKRANECVVERVHIQAHNIRDFPHVKLNKKYIFVILCNEHGKLYLLHHPFSRIVYEITKKNWQKFMATLLGSEMNCTGGDITGRT